MKRPIGMLDSGVGGLTVVRELMRQLPKEKIIYIGDTLRCPYGPRPFEEVRKFTWELVRFLLTYNIKMLVIACNTATAVVLDALQRSLDIPVVGVIAPGTRAALKVTRSKRIGVIGTKGTIHSDAYQKSLKMIDNYVYVKSVACPDFVPIVERGDFHKKQTFEIVKKNLLPFQFEEIDTLILGCTHYPLLQKQIQKAMGRRVTLINSGEETGRELSTILQYSNLLNIYALEGKHKFFTTGDAAMFERIASQWLDEKNYVTQQIRLE